MTFTHGGHLRRLANHAGCRPAELLDFSASINPLGPPKSLRSVVARNLDCVVHYPDPDCSEFTREAADHLAVLPDQIVVGNGSTELLHAAARAVGRTRAVIPSPSYSDYANAARLAGMAVELCPLSETSGFAVDWNELEGCLRGDEVVFLGQPNNPTGSSFAPERFGRFAAKHSDSIFLVDEAFIEFTQDVKSLTEQTLENVIVLRSMTKFYAIPGLRLGYAVTSPPWAQRLREQLTPWSTNTLAQAVGAMVLQDAEYMQQTRELVNRQREKLRETLGSFEGLKVFPSCTNYLLVKLERSGTDVPTLASRLLKERIAIRDCSNFEGLDNHFFRVAVRLSDENRRLVDALQTILGGQPSKGRQKTKRHTASLMLQGTSSNAGKSVLTAAICRILLQDGVRVAPFKAQNMSLNSFVTRDGGEMGRAQVVQAQACRLQPHVRMNPVLLKPNSDTGSQVIVNGKPVGNMRVGQYLQYKPKAFQQVQRSYDSLAEEFDAVVIEGAGSPAEVNLKSHDIVNMRMARYANAPVLLVGDIDRGGVFASFVGTMELLTAEERRLVQGFIINRFRGDASLLGPALEHTQAHTGKPTLGIVPFLPDLGLPEEDSVEFKNKHTTRPAVGDETIDVAVVDLPHISNFTDMDALETEDDVHVRIIRSVDDVGIPDAIILPGSKSVVGDLEYLKQSGLAAVLTNLATVGRTLVVGICGGFQMLGTRIVDPLHVESQEGEAIGLGLLSVTTSLAAEKTLARSTAVHLPSGLQVTGYEIHHGQTEIHDARNPFQTPDSKVIGAANDWANVWGTYLHGVFDADPFRRWFIDRLRQRRGLAPRGGVTASYDIEPALNRLADVVRNSLDMGAIYRRMGL